MKRTFKALTVFLLAAAMVFSAGIAPVGAADHPRPVDDTDFGSWYGELQGIFADDNFAAYVAYHFTKDEGHELAAYPAAVYTTVEAVLASYVGTADIDASYNTASAKHSAIQALLTAMDSTYKLERIEVIDDILLLPRAMGINLTNNYIHDLTPLAYADLAVGYFGSDTINLTLTLNGNPLEIWPERFAGNLQLNVDSYTFPNTTLTFLNIGSVHSIKVPVTLQASGENGVHIWQASGPYDPAAPTTNPTGAQWVKGINDVGTSAEDSTSNLLNDITITEIAGEGSFYYTYTTSYISRFNLNKYATSGGSTPDQLTYSVAFPFDVEFYDEYEARVAAKGAVIFTKTDLDTGEALGGAQYSLYRVVDGDDELIGTYTTGTTEDTLGQIVVTGLEAGNYYFTEIAPPPQTPIR